MFKKFFSIFMSIIMLFSFHSFGMVDENFKINSEELLIIEITDYFNSYENKIARETVLNKIKRNISYNIETVYTYSDIFNGFSIYLNTKYIDYIKTIENVIGVYVSQIYDVPEIIDPVTISSQNVHNDMSYFNSLENEGLNGEGLLIAVIDSEFLPSHSSFCITDPSKVKYKPEDMQKIFEDNELNCEENATYEDTYYNEKIPFIYDYGQMDLNTISTSQYHGTGVASVVGGNGSVKGTAPEAQLALFKISRPGEDIVEAAYLNALDDALKMKVDAVNISFGSLSGIINYWGGNEDKFNFSKVSEKFNESGIPIFVAVGNNGTIGNGNSTTTKTPLASMPDYGMLSSQAMQKYVNSVASSETVFRDSDLTGSISSFSSNGCSSNLNLAPTITYDGRSITLAGNSSVNELKVASGTSFSSPLTCGLYVSLKQYVNEHYTFNSEYEKMNFINQLLMSTSDIIMQTTSVPHSPRKQGAGCANIYDAINSPAVIIGSFEKSLVNLYDNLSNEFSFTFDIKNYSDKQTVSYSLSGNLITDGYKKVNNRNYTTLTSVKIPAHFDFSNNETITISPGERKTITVSVTADKEFIDNNIKIFTNGFFMEGFITLIPNSDEYTKLNFPFMGFYGKWDEIPIFDTEGFYNKSGIASPNASSKDTAVYSSQFPYIRLYNTNRVNKNVTDRFYIHPTSQNLLLTLGAIRSGTDLKATLASNSKNYGTIDLQSTFSKLIYKNNKYSVELWNGLNLTNSNTFPDGNYTITYSGKAEYENAVTQYQIIDVVIDRISPTINSVARIVKNNHTYLNINVCDNEMLQYVNIETLDDNGNVITSKSYSYPIDAASFTYNFDITNSDNYRHRVSVYDYADNKTDYAEDLSGATSYMASFNEMGLMLDIITKKGIMTDKELTANKAALSSGNPTSILYYIWNNLRPLSIPSVR